MNSSTKAINVYKELGYSYENTELLESLGVGMMKEIYNSFADSKKYYFKHKHCRENVIFD